MKNIHTFIIATLCAALLLSGCNTDKSAVTTAVTEEATTTMTAETTTTAASTTTTTAKSEPELPVSDFGYYLQSDNTIYICDYHGTDKDVIVPEYISDYPVTSIMMPLMPESYNDGSGTVARTGTEIETVTLPKTIKTMQYHEYLPFRTIKSYSVDPENEEYTAVDGVLYSKDMTKLLLYPPAKEGRFTVPDSVTEIGGGAFSYCVGLTTVNIGSNVKTIGVCAFENSSVSEVNIAEGLESIEWEAFRWTKELESIVLPRSLKTIESRAFESSALRSVTLPTAIDKFCSDVFTMTELSEINLVDNGEGLYMWNDILRKGDELIRMIKGSKVEKLVFDSTVTSLDCVFENCTNLKVIEIMDDCDFIITMTEFGDFIGCTSIEQMYIPGSVVSCPFYHYYQEMSPDLVVYTPEKGENSSDGRNSGEKCKFVYVDSYEDYLKAVRETG